MPLLRTFAAAVAVLLGALPLAAQPATPIEADGPFAVGFNNVAFTDTNFGQGRISGRVYYPATASGPGAQPDPSGGPFPLVAFQHGYLGRPSNYDALSAHIASWGFVVASTGTETGFFPDQFQYARDTRSLLYYVEDQSGAAGPFAGMVDDGPWAASGHSMGGGVLAILVGIEPRVRTVIGLQSAFVNDSRIGDLAAFTGAHFQIAGSRDRIVPPSQVVRYFGVAEAARRNVYFEVQGMGHSGPTDTPPNGEPLSAAEQRRLHRRLVTGILRAEQKGQEDLYAEILGAGIEDEPVVFESDCADPPLWVRPSAEAPDALLVGAAGAPGATITLAWSDERDPRPTPYGEAGIALDPARTLYDGPADATGTAEALLPLAQVGGADSVFVQGLALGAEVQSVTRVDARAVGGSAPLALGGDVGTTARLLGVYPNPFVEGVVVRFEADGASGVEVYDVLGRRVRTLPVEEARAGRQEVRWDGLDAAGRPVAPGLYVVRVQAGQGVLTQPVVRAR